MTASCPSEADRLLKGKGGVQSWACQAEPGERAGISQAPASGPFLGTGPHSRLGGGGWIPPPTFHSLCVPKAEIWLREGRSHSKAQKEDLCNKGGVCLWRASPSPKNARSI